MKFILNVKDSVTGKEWPENYDLDIEDANEYAVSIFKSFNETLRPHENPRELVSVEVIESDNNGFHKWFKLTDGQSVIFRGKIADLMKCEKCGITGKKCAC